MSTLRWAGTTALALVGLAVIFHLLVWLLDPLVPWLIVLLVLLTVFGILVRGR